jgi:NADPH-dependent 2,4-dienoyl-CoA reductase/sulfur reductase-like enzyme
VENTSCWNWKSAGKRPDLGAYLREWSPLVDIVQLRAPTVELAHPVGLNSTSGLPLTLEYARQLKKMELDVLLAPVGGFQSPEQNEMFLAQGMTDMVCMARAFLCESQYYQKILSGRSKDVVPCIRCNKCHTKPAEPDPGCSVNPQLELQLEPGYQPPHPAAQPRRIAVIGGGPAGIEAALTASSLGHQVTLFEKETDLGGQLRYAAVPDFKWPVRKLLEHLKTQLRASAVTVRCGVAATPELLAEQAWDAIWIATGAVMEKPNIPGLACRQTSTAVEVLAGTLPRGKRVAVVGGSETGIETAMYLARQGYQVTLLTRQFQVAKDAHDVHYREICEEYWRSEPNLSLLTNAETTALTANGLRYRQNGTERDLDCDDVVLCGYGRPVTAQIEAYGALAPQVRILGDCRKPADIRRAMRDGYAVAVTLT